MASLTFNKKEVEKYIKVDDKMIESSTMMGAPAELNGDSLTIEITPNRPDLLSLQGFLRAFKAFTGKEKGLKKYKINAPEKNFRVKIDSSVNAIRPYTACAIVKGVNFSDANIKDIIDMQEKLHATLGRNRKKMALGIYPLEKIKLPIKYEAKKPSDIKFRPLEFSDEINGLQILQRHPTGRQYAPLLEGLDKFPVFSDANGNILSMPPIINSHETGRITESTKDVFIECSGFDFRTLKIALNIVVVALADMGGKIYAMELEYAKKEITPDLTPEAIKINVDRINKLTGLNIKEKDLESLLNKMGYEYKSGKAMVPAWRADILHEVDIIEDVAIAYGYDKIEPEIPRVATIGSESFESKIESKISAILTGLGLLEISTYHLIKEEELNKTKLAQKIEVSNSKTEYKFLRTDLIVPALRIINENKDNEYPQKFFEVGNTFYKNENKLLEDKKLIVAVTPGNFTELKQILDYLTKMLGISYQLSEGKHRNLIEGRTGEIKFNNKSMGFIGEVNLETLRNWNIKMPISIIEISLKEIIENLKNN